MYRRVFILAAILAVTAVFSPAHATTAAAPRALAPAAETFASVEAVGCWGHGWRGWAWYPGVLRCAAIAAPPPYAYVVEAPVAYAPPPAPVHRVPGQCWVTTDPDRNLRYWRAC